MSTRACYTFKSDRESHHVFIHYDGYPTGAAAYLSAALESGLIWPLPRYESDEFAAGFVAANKKASGGVRLVKSPRNFADIAYRYTVTQKDSVLYILVQSVDYWDKPKTTKLWTGTLQEFIETGAESIE